MKLGLSKNFFSLDLSENIQWQGINPSWAQAQAYP
jgi:hypothetical protein